MWALRVEERIGGWVAGAAPARRPISDEAQRLLVAHVSLLGELLDNCLVKYEAVDLTKNA
jgi:hypothetical protein